MPITAKISSSYRWRIGIIGLGLLAFAGWFFYDWGVRYPAYREKQLAYQEIAQDDSLSIKEKQAQWVETAKENGWPQARPEKPMSESDIETQLWYGLPCLVLSLPILGTFILMGRRYVAVDAQSLYNHRGRRATWDRINDIDKSRWQTKGIAAVYYADEANQTKKIVLDDWKYQRDPIQQILAQVESEVYPQAEQDQQDQQDEHDEADEPANAERPVDEQSRFDQQTSG